MGNPLDTAFVPMDILAYPQEMTFFQRVRNTLTTLGSVLFIKNSIVKPTGKQLASLMDLEEAPDLYEHGRMASLVFYNDHPVFG